MQKGDKTKPVLVLLHAFTATRIGKPLVPLLPDDMPIMSLQAPELVSNFPVKTSSERALAYRDILISEWGDYNPTMHLCSYSLSGPLSYELALCMQDTNVKCASLCLLDPVPYCPRPDSTMSYLMQRARTYDSAIGLYARKDTNFS